MKKNNDEKNLIFLFSGAFLIMAFFMIFAHKASAASETDYFPMTQNKNGHFTEDWITKFNNQIDTDNYYCVVMYRYYQTALHRHHFYLVRFPKTDTGSIFAEKNNDLIHFSLYPIGSLNAQNGTAYIQDGNLHIQWGGNYQQTWHNMESSNYNSSIDYISNFSLFTSNNPDLAQVVMFYDDGITIPEGDTARDDTPKPNSSDYFPDWSESPSFDNSSVENGLNSVFNIISWLGNNIKDSITSLGSYIVDSTMWGMQKIIDTIRDKIDEVKTAISNVITTINTTLGSIQNAIQNFKLSMENLKTTIEEIADLFIHPFNEEEYQEQIADCELINQYNTLIDNCEVIQQIFDYAEEENHFSLYIDFENPFADSEHKIIHSEINFDWLVPLRSVYRPFLWVFTLFECFVGGMRVLGNVIGGKAK